MITMNNKERIDHDQLFKELLQNFFEEFMLLFFPEIYEVIDFSHIAFLDKELITDVKSRKKLEVDIIVETKFRQEDTLIIIHVEPQASHERDFNERMFIYFSRLLEKHKKQILPIALFSYDSIKDEPNTFEMNFPFFNVLKFQFLTIELKKLNWRDFIRKDNPVAGALLSKMGYNEQAKVQVKKEFILMLARMELDLARTELLLGFFETYLKLNQEQEHTLKAEFQNSKETEANVMKIISSYRKEGRIEGRIEGREEGKLEGKFEGKLEGKRDSIHTVFETKFGLVSEELRNKLRTIDNVELLNEVLKKTIAAQSLQEAEDAIESAMKKH